MTVRFKGQSEDQKSYGASPQRHAPLGSSGEAAGPRRAPSAASRSCSPHHDPPLMASEPPTVPHRPAMQADQALRWKAGLRPRGQRSGGHRSEYHRQFGWKKPVSAASPLLTAERVLHSSSRSLPPFKKKNPVSMETEYGRSFRGLKPAPGPRLRRHLEREREPVFHTHRIHRRKSLELPPKAEAARGDGGARTAPGARPQPAQVQRRRRNPEGGGDTDDINAQVKELRQQAQTYRLRAWGTNFSRDHLSQLLSEHNALWEPSDTTDSRTEPSTPRLSPEPDGRTASCVEALDLASNSSSGSSAGVGGLRKTRRSPGTETPPGPGDERRTAWGEREDTDDEEGRLPTPRLKTRPVTRTHHDLTTPATGGAILVGKLINADAASPSKQKEKFGTAVLRESGSEADLSKPAKSKEAWSENTAVSLSPSPNHKHTPSPQPQPIRTKQASPCPPASPPQHGIQGMLRHPDFQHNGELGLRVREPPCSRGGCGSDEDDRLSVMSWRSAASCSAASAVLERAQRRRESFWGKR